jgi:Ni/Co efflux regulator RcnB
MRKLLLSVLLAGAVAAPAFADPGDNMRHQGNRAEREQVRNDRSEARAERQQARVERQEQKAERQQVRVEQPNVERQQRMQAAERRGDVREQRFDRSENGLRARGVARANAADVERIQAAREAQRERSVQVRNWRERPQQAQGGLVQPNRELPRVMRTRDRSPVVSDTPRRGTQPPLRVDGRRWANTNWDRNWDRNWRNDHRYDWRRWRDRNRNRFRLGFYNDPFRWGYQRFSIGWRLWPSYYGSNYWINNPAYYRLPYAPPGTRWVRYYDDALLVDTFTGQVVDVIYNFFW